MKSIETEITIDAPAHIVWAHLVDFPRFGEWNHFIPSISGDLKQGAVWQVTIHPPGGKEMHFSPVCTKLIPGKQLQWKGKVLMNGLFDGEHIFILQPLNDEQTLFIQKENFSGILVPLFWNSMHQKTKDGFSLMNRQLKERAESAAWTKIN